MWIPYRFNTVENYDVGHFIVQPVGLGGRLLDQVDILPLAPDVHHAPMVRHLGGLSEDVVPLLFAENELVVGFLLNVPRRVDDPEVHQLDLIFFPAWQVNATTVNQVVQELRVGLALEDAEVLELAFLELGCRLLHN